MNLETIEGTKDLGRSQNLHSLNIFELFDRENDRSSLIELKKLPSKFRNKVRAIISSSDSKSIELMNNLRKKCSPPEIFQIEKTLRANRKIIPELFPQAPQTKEDYLRLVALPLHTQIDLLQRLTTEYSDKIQDTIKIIKEINFNITEQNYPFATENCKKLAERHGYSHLLLRKIALIRALKGGTSPEIEEILNLAGAGSNNLITSSLINCYQEEQDILSLKRSIMNLPNKGNGNKFTRDITRLNFHPHAKDEEELSELILSNLQSSLIDALLVTKINKNLLAGHQHQKLLKAFQLLASSSPGINEIASLYKNDEEHIFYKHSSAWLEDSEIALYRTLIDNFHDTPDSDYVCLNEDVFSRISTWLNEIELSSLATNCQMTKHSHKNLAHLEMEGHITRSAVFNYIIHKTDGCTQISDLDLIKIMGKTSSLDRTISISATKNLAGTNPSSLAKIILYSLISKRSKNEADNYKLRSILQKKVISDHDSSLVEFIKQISEQSKEVAQYLYEICTEDFIARLSHLIKTSNAITETRASLHKWMGEHTGEKAYLNRARTLLIDHQINRVRNELDDNRIYVHAARFLEWVSDEVIRDLGTILTSMDHNNTLNDENNPQLLSIIEHCYRAFCSNALFGIASYLGRRIRHGTFKGHLFSNVVIISENEKYQTLFREPNVVTKWAQWRKNYEEIIDRIITNKLHVESQTKREGLLKPHINDAKKIEAAIACTKSLAKEYSEHKATNNFGQIIVEYCWRMVEVDLRNVNSYLKSQKQPLIQAELLNSMKSGLYSRQTDLFKDFNRDLMRSIDEKLIAMYGWFKRPLSVSPKASLSLLYKAVTEEVKETFPDFDAESDFEESNDLELMGGPYHILYDAFYVVVYNAAKHGKPSGSMKREFGIHTNGPDKGGKVYIKIASEIKDDDDEGLIAERLEVRPDADIENAHLEEVRSGIRKLYQLERADNCFAVDEISCKNRMVNIHLSYKLEHL